LIGGTSIFGGRATIIGTVFGSILILMFEPARVATGRTGAWVRTIQGMVFLISIIFYLFVDEPQRRRTFYARFAFGRGAAAGGGTMPPPNTRQPPR
jgi:simple sugar transport system permease protein